MGKVHRLDSVGNLFLQGELNEIALLNTNIMQRIDGAGNFYVREFNEVVDPDTVIEGA